MKQVKYTPGKILVKNTMINLMGMVLPILVGILTIPYALKGLSNEGFGILSIAWVIIGYFSILDFGISRATTKYVAETLSEQDNKELPSIFWTAGFVNFLFGIIGAIILVAATPYLVQSVLKISPDFIRVTELSFYLSACSLPVILFSTSLRGVLGAAQRFDLVNLILIPVSILSFVFPALSYPFGFDLFTVILLIIISRVTATFFYLFFCLKIFPALKTQLGINWLTLRKLISYGGWVTITGIISPILVYIDRIFIGSLLSVSVVAFYTAPYDTTNRIRVLPISVMTTLFPEFSSLSHQDDKNRIEMLISRSIKFILLPTGVIGILLLFYAPEILQLWLGEEFSNNAAIVLRILSIGIVINSLAYIPFNLLQGIGRPDLPAKFHMIEFPVYIVLLWYMTINYGINGAAAAWLVRVTLDFFLLYWCSAKHYPNVFRSLGRKGIVREGLLLFVLAILILSGRLLIADLAAEMVLLIVLLTTFSIIVWYHILDSSEKETLLQYVKGLLPS